MHKTEQKSTYLRVSRVWFSPAQNVKCPEITSLLYGAIQMKLIWFWNLETDMACMSVVLLNNIKWTSDVFLNKRKSNWRMKRYHVWKWVLDLIFGLNFRPKLFLSWTHICRPSCRHFRSCWLQLASFLPCLGSRWQTACECTNSYSEFAATRLKRNRSSQFIWYHMGACKPCF